MIDFTPELRAEAVKIASRYKIGPIFTPPPVSKVEGPIAGSGLRRHQWPGGRSTGEHIDYVPSFTAMPVLACCRRRTKSLTISVRLATR